MDSAQIAEAQGLRLHITGVVQGVGFRPFVYGLARRYGLTGWVRNTSAGVDIEADGPAAALAGFAAALRDELPPLARIDSFSAEPRPADGYTSFDIRASRPEPGAFQPVSADMALCPDCLRELFDPADRRYRYPFINCTNCGPRFTIIRDIPYDRPLTTMAAFPMCPACAAEYHDPRDRRFHAQPNACPACGPRVWLETGRPTTDERLSSVVHHPSSILGEAAIQEARRLLAEGRIVAVKGLGGFHLACDALSDAAVQRLRTRKGRADKPLAIMATDLEAVRALAEVDDAEAALLTSKERPIVLLRQRVAAGLPPLSSLVAPGNPYVGVMLPYTPLH